MGKKTTVQKNDPWAPAQPYILNSLAAVDDTFRQNQPALQGAASDFYGAYSRSAPGAETGIGLAQSRVNDTISGRFAGQNPGRQVFMDGMRGLEVPNFGAAIGNGATTDFSSAVNGRNPSSAGFGDFAAGRAMAGNPAAAGFGSIAGGVSPGAGMGALDTIMRGRGGTDFSGAVGSTGAGAGAFGEIMRGRGGTDFAGAVGGLAGNEAASGFRGVARGVSPNAGMQRLGGIMAGRRGTDFAGAVGSNRAAPMAERLGEGGFVGRGEGADLFRRTIGGEFLQGNPYLEGQIKSATDDAADRTNSLFSSAGRFGSSAHQGTVAREAGRISNDARFANFQAERDRQMTAAGSLDGLTRADRGLQLNAINTVGDLSARDQSARLQSLGMQADERGRITQEQIAASSQFDQSVRADRGQQLQALGALDGITGRDAGLRLQSAGMQSDEQGRIVQERLAAAGQLDQSGRADAGLRLQSLGMQSDEQGRIMQERLSAAGQLDQSARADRGQQLQALGALDGIAGRNNEMQLRALGALDGSFGRQQGLDLQAMGMGADNMRANSGQRLQAAGMQQDAAMARLQMRMQAADAADRGYNLDMARQDQAIGTAQDLRAGNLGLLGNAAQLPWLGVQAQAGGVTGLSSPYGTRTTTDSGNALGAIAGLAGTLGGEAIKAGMFASDRKLKNDKGVVGIDPNTGLPLHSYTYKSDPAKTPQVGVMAQDVQKVAPEAVGISPNGFMNVDYGKLGLPSPTAMAAELQFQQPEKVRRPLGQMLHNAFAKDSDGNIGDTVSRIGESLLAGAGGSWSDIGKGLLGARADRREDAQQERAFGVQERQADRLAAFRAAQGARGGLPRIIQRRDGTAMMIDPMTGESEIIGEPLANNEPLVKVADGKGGEVFTPRSQAAGKPAYRAPAKPAGGGGVTANQRAQILAQAAAARAAGVPEAKIQERLRSAGVM